MPTCKKCKSGFPNRITIDGKKKILSNRKYCLECSPWNKHNTKQIHLNDKTVILCACGREYVYSRKAGHTKTKCNSCLANSRRLETKQKCVEYKGGKCERCGYNKCIHALSFHHLDPKEKDFNISGNHGRKWESIKKELDKCILVCMNCHTEIHSEK